MSTTQRSSKGDRKILSIADLSPDQQIALDVFQRDSPEFDLSEHALHHYASATAPFLECLRCGDLAEHPSSCTCLAYDSWTKRWALIPWWKPLLHADRCRTFRDGGTR
jgi:hypothetical protein